MDTHARTHSEILQTTHFSSAPFLREAAPFYSIQKNSPFLSTDPSFTQFKYYTIGFYHNRFAIKPSSRNWNTQ